MKTDEIQTYDAVRGYVRPLHSQRDTVKSNEEQNRVVKPSL